MEPQSEHEVPTRIKNRDETEVVETIETRHSSRWICSAAHLTYRISVGEDASTASPGQKNWIPGGGGSRGNVVTPLMPGNSTAICDNTVRERAKLALTKHHCIRNIHTHDKPFLAGQLNRSS